MLSFIHTADLHLGIYPYGKPNPRTGMNTSLESTLSCLDELVFYAIGQKVRFVVFSGDFSKEKVLTELMRSELFKRFKKLSDNGIDIYALIGNHDSNTSKGTTYNIKSLSVMGLENIHVIDEPTLISKKDYAFIGMPYIESVETWLEEYKNLRRKMWGNKKKIVVALHGNVEGCKRYSELLETDEPTDIPKSIFQDDGILYVACGHQHEHQILGEKPCIAYSGSLDRVRMDERDHQKGFMSLKYDDGKFTKKFVNVSARKFLQIESDGRSLPKDIDFTGSIVKVIIENKKDSIDSFMKEALKKRVMERGAEFVDVKTKIISLQEMKKIEVKTSTSVKSRVGDWCEKNVPSELKDEVRKMALQTLSDMKENNG